MSSDLTRAVATILRALKDRYPSHLLLGDHKEALTTLVIRSQRGTIKKNLEHLQRYGGYLAGRGPNLSLEEVQGLTSKMFESRKNWLKMLYQRPYLTDDDLKHEMRPIFQEILDRAWRSRDQVLEWSDLSVMRNLATKFKVNEVPYQDLAEDRSLFFDRLQKAPLGVAKDGHSVTVVGYDKEQHMLWIRDSLSKDDYYPVAVDDFMPRVAYYYFLEIIPGKD